MMARESVDPERDIVEIDTSVAHAARIYDYMLGGQTNFQVDREAAEHAAEAVPGGFEGVRAGVRANRAFLGRAVRHLVREAGIRQFLDIGTGIPTEDNVHDVAQREAPESRIVYVDNDPIVLAHSSTLLKSSAEGVTHYVHGDMRDPRAVLAKAAEVLDLTQPVAVMLVGVLHFVTDDDDPQRIVRTLLDAVPSGSYLILSHVASDISAAEMAEGIDRLNQQADEVYFLRSREQVARFFDGLEMLEPGLVRVEDWRPDWPEGGAGAAPGTWSLPVYGGVARKP
jgi:O-methyltransferase involved in polyketide biosynthesis